MPRRPLTTIPERRVPTMALIAPGSVLLDACREAGRYAGISSIEVTDVASAPTNVAKWRPFAIVMEEDVYAFDPDEFAALARDVGGEVIIVPASAVEGSPEEAHDAVIRTILPKLKAAFRRWDEEGEPPP